MKFVPQIEEESTDEASSFFINPLIHKQMFGK